MIADLIKANRSCRRFDQQHRIDMATLLELVDLARLSASAANLQPLKYILSCGPATNTKIFECLKKETIVIDDLNAEGDIRYWRDGNQVHHVPKRRLEDIVVANHEI